VSRVDDLWRWLLEAVEGRPTVDHLFGRFCAELLRRGLPLWRGSLGLELLHPEVSGTQFIWTDASAPVSLFEAARAGIVQSPSYQNSPTRIVDETDRPFRRRLDAPCPDMPLMEELRLKGATDYLMLPLPFVERSRTAVMAFATRQPGGFTSPDLDELSLAARLFSPYAERHVLHRIAEDLIETYVGSRTARRILKGQIERGTFDRVEAALWFADLRGFTRLSETAPVSEVIGRLNAWLEAMVEVIANHDGEVLKFLGDGLLAIFPTSSERPPAQACADALAAALAVSSARGAQSGAARSDHVLALHYGEVAYGNVGAPRRLDFTVIGPAVNRAARLQELAKRLDRTAVASRAFAQTLGQPLEDLGTYRLRGILKAQRVFGLPV